ncbi:hypothetical protein [Streptosporangium sp. NPDC051022]|uniref:hypothetical protein n=1 Tax=Streptosporangium sp. NPDC051022 TaxID=3155752 RepID=UPI0034428BBC
MNPDEHRPANRELDALQKVADAASQELAEHITITSAEGVVASARVAQLNEQSRKAFRRISSMRGQLTRAQKDGDAAKIAAARKKLDQASDEFDRISKACIAEGHEIVQAGLERTGTTFALMRESWDAGDAVVEAHRHPNESRQRDE